MFIFMGKRPMKNDPYVCIIKSLKKVFLVLRSGNALGYSLKQLITEEPGKHERRQ